MEEQKVILSLNEFEKLLDTEDSYIKVHGQCILFEESIYNYVYKYNKDYFKDIDLEEGVDDYNYRHIFKELNELGYTSTKQIHNMITRMVKDYNRENKESDE